MDSVAASAGVGHVPRRAATAALPQPDLRAANDCIVDSAAPTRRAAAFAAAVAATTVGHRATHSSTAVPRLRIRGAACAASGARVAVRRVRASAAAAASLATARSRSAALQPARSSEVKSRDGSVTPWEVTAAAARDASCMLHDACKEAQGRGWEEGCESKGGRGAVIERYCCCNCCLVRRRCEIAVYSDMDAEIYRRKLAMSAKGERCTKAEGERCTKAEGERCTKDALQHSAARHRRAAVVVLHGAIIDLQSSCDGKAAGRLL
eukprot:161647-Chlamydomonas_euryale.AAC.5